MEHIPVLLKETIEGLNVNENGVYVDLTLGRGGHSSRILSLLKNGTGHLYCFDQDIEAIKESEEKLKAISSSFTLIHDNFENLKTRIKEFGVNEIDGALFDLGVSSCQFDDGARGFSYRYDALLDMRMNQETSLTAETIVNTYSLQELVRIFKEYGEENNAYIIAKAIVKRREQTHISTTFELVDIIKGALPCKVLNKKGHPAKQVFQALRIEVNNEMEVLKKGLMDACSLLKDGGRVAVITFQSLEDRIVKNIFKQLCYEGEGSRRLPVEKRAVEYYLVNKKVITASDIELSENSRSHSAKLRIIERRKAK